MCLWATFRIQLTNWRCAIDLKYMQCNFDKILKKFSTFVFQVKVAIDGNFIFIIIRYLLVFVLLPAVATGNEREGLGFEYHLLFVLEN